MQVGLNLPVINPEVTPDVLRSVAARAEALGFAELYLGEHVVLFDEQVDDYPGATQKTVPFPPETQMPDPLVALAWLAGSTSAIRLATGVMILPQRNPLYTAKHIATLDWLSGGRLDVGIGLGWSSLEYRALGVPWTRRGNRCDEYIDLLRRLWFDGPAEFQGRFWDLPKVYQRPSPVQPGGPPIWIGGSSKSAMARVAARGDGWYLFNSPPEWIAQRLAALDVQLERFGRQRSELTIAVGTAGSSPLSLAALEAYARVGVDQVAVTLQPGSPRDLYDELDQTAERLGVGAC